MGGCYSDDVIQARKVESINRQMNHPYSYLPRCTRHNFIVSLEMLKTFPSCDPETECNMLSIIGKCARKDTPELFQIYKLDNMVNQENNSESDSNDENNTGSVYYFSHLEEGTHTRLSYFKIEDIGTFELDAYNPNFRIELIRKDTTVNMILK